MGAKKAFVLYLDYEEHISLLSDEQCGVLLKAIYAHETGKDIPKMDGMVKMAFSFIAAQLDRDSQKYEKTSDVRSEAGKKGGRPKKEKQKVLEKSKKSKCFSEKA